MNTLPNDIINQIISFVPSWKEIVIVNKNWNNLVNKKIANLKELTGFADLLKKEIQEAPANKYLKITLLFPLQPQLKLSIETGYKKDPVQEILYLFKGKGPERIKSENMKTEETTGYKQVIDFKLDYQLYSLMPLIEQALTERHLLISKAHNEL